MMQKILIGIGVLVIAIGGGVYFLLGSLDSIIKEAVEKYGSEVTKAEVSLDQVKIDIASGKGGLNGLVVGNPQGFETPSAFKLGAVSVIIDTSTVTEDPVVIKEIAIDAPEVTYELSSAGSNIDAIQKNVEAYMAQFGGGGEKKAESSGEGPKLVIEHFYVRNGKVSVSASILAGKAMGAPLPDIHLTDIGKDEGGATPAEVAEEMLTSISDGATKAVGSIGIGNTLESLENAMGGVTKGAEEAVGAATESVGKALEGVGGGDATKGATDAVTEGAAEAGKALKGLFGK